MAIAYDWSGKTAPVRIYRVYDLSSGKWIYNDAPNYLLKVARASALEGKRTFEIRMLEIERSQNKDSILTILNGGTFWKNEYIVCKVNYKSSTNPISVVWCEGDYKLLVPTPDQKREEEERIRREDERAREHERAYRERGRARQAREEAEARAREYTADEPYFATEDEFWAYMRQNDDKFNQHRNEQRRSAPTQNKFEKILQIIPPYNLDDLTAQYRKRAKETHPDAGGSNEAFIELTQAYKDIKTVRGW